jgi:hypothetical protein
MKMAALILTSLLWTGLSAGQNLNLPEAAGDRLPATDMHQKHAQEMKAQVAEMRRALAQMKTNASALKDGAARKQAQLDAVLWEQMVAHLERMSSMAAEEDGHAAMSCGGMHQAGNRECCADMQREDAGSPARPGCCEMTGAMKACTHGGLKSDSDHAAHQHPDEGTNPK